MARGRKPRRAHKRFIQRAGLYKKVAQKRRFEAGNGRFLRRGTGVKKIDNAYVCV